jgi:hypothetical protein
MLKIFTDFVALLGVVGILLGILGQAALLIGGCILLSGAIIAASIQAGKK